MMSMQYGSDEWIAAWWNAARVNGSISTTAATWVYGPTSIRLTDAPSGTPEGYVLEIADGKLIALRQVRDREITPFTITMKFERFKAVLAGTLDLVDGVIQGKISFTGDLPALRRHKQLFSALVVGVAELGTEFPVPTEA
jgi:hypothetical protein